MVAYLPAASSLEMQLTSGQFDSSLFALATGEDFESDTSYKMPVSEELYVQDSLVTLGSRETPVDIKINGMTATTGSPTTGTYKVTTTGTTTTISFATGDFANGDPVEVNYSIVKSNAVSVNVSNDQAAIGEAILKWPVNLYAA